MEGAERFQGVHVGGSQGLSGVLGAGGHRGNDLAEAAYEERHDDEHAKQDEGDAPGHGADHPQHYQGCGEGGDDLADESHPESHHLFAGFGGKRHHGPGAVHRSAGEDRINDAVPDSGFFGNMTPGHHHGADHDGGKRENHSPQNQLAATPINDGPGTHDG